MQIHFSVKAVGLVTFTIMAICTSTLKKSDGAERIGMPVFNVSQIRPEITEATREDVTIYGDVLVRSHGIAIIRDQDRPEMSIRLDTRRLGSVDRRRLLRKCALTACSEIVSGRIFHGTLYAEDVIPFRSANQMRASPELSLPASSADASDIWQCHDLKQCT